MKPGIIDIPGIGPATVETLAGDRITTLRALSHASVERLAALPGFSVARATRIKEMASVLLADEETGTLHDKSERRDAGHKHKKKDKKSKKDKKKKKGKKHKKRKKDKKDK